MKEHNDNNLLKEINDTTKKIGGMIGQQIEFWWPVREQAVHYWARRALLDKRIGLVTTEPSMTVQGQDLGVKDLLVKHANGILPAIQKEGIFDEDPDHEDEDFSNLQRMDIAERERIRDFAASKVSKLNEDLNSKRKVSENVHLKNDKKEVKNEEGEKTL